MVILQSVTYRHINRDLRFADLNLVVNKNDKIALIGNNGSGKSTLLRLIAGDLPPSSGVIESGRPVYHVPQIYGQFNELTVAEVLKIEDKLKALKEILSGDVSEENMTLLKDGWTIEKPL